MKFSFKQFESNNFLESTDTSVIIKKNEHVFAILGEFVEKIREENLVQFVMNNVANYKAAKEMLMKKRKKKLF